MVAEPVINDWIPPHFKRQNQQTGGQTEQRLGEREESKRWLGVKGRSLWMYCGALPCLLNQARLGEGQFEERDINSLFFKDKFLEVQPWAK